MLTFLAFWMPLTAILWTTILFVAVTGSYWYIYKHSFTELTDRWELSEEAWKRRVDDYVEEVRARSVEDKDS